MCDGVIGTAVLALLSFSIVGQQEGDGMTIDGYRERLGWPASFLTEVDAWSGTSASSSVMSYKESKSLSARLMRLAWGYDAVWEGKRGDAWGVMSKRRALGVGKSSPSRGDTALGRYVEEGE
jgi:hypothetical protein